MTSVKRLDEVGYVLDTNVLLHDHHALTYFSKPKTWVIVPLYVLEELDLFKGELSDRGQRTREVTRALDKIRIQNEGTLYGASLTGGGRLLIVETHHEFSARERLSPHLLYDQLILNCTLDLSFKTSQIPREYRISITPPQKIRCLTNLNW